MSGGYYRIYTVFKCPFLSRIASAMQDSDMDIDVATHNILLFISALIPKALAALMTSILVELAKPEHVRIACLTTFAITPM